MSSFVYAAHGSSLFGAAYVKKSLVAAGTGHAKRSSRLLGLQVSPLQQILTAKNPASKKN